MYLLLLLLIKLNDVFDRIEPWGHAKLSIVTSSHIILISHAVHLLNAAQIVLVAVVATVVTCTSVTKKCCFLFALGFGSESHAVYVLLQGRQHFLFATTVHTVVVWRVQPTGGVKIAQLFVQFRDLCLLYLSLFSGLMRVYRVASRIILFCEIVTPPPIHVLLLLVVVDILALQIVCLIACTSSTSAVIVRRRVTLSLFGGRVLALQTLELCSHRSLKVLLILLVRYFVCALGGVLRACLLQLLPDEYSARPFSLSRLEALFEVSTNVLLHSQRALLEYDIEGFLRCFVTSVACCDRLQHLELISSDPTIRSFSDKDCAL